MRAGTITRPDAAQQTGHSARQRPQDDHEVGVLRALSVSAQLDMEELDRIPWGEPAPADGIEAAQGNRRTGAWD